MAISFFNNYEINLSENSDLNWNYVKDINALIAGKRGSGKSFLGLMMTKSIAGNFPYGQIFIVDFKRSDFYRLSALLPERRVASTKEEIFDLLEYYTKLMRQRIKFFETIPNSFGKTARDLKMPPFYLIYDEFGSFTSKLDTKEKKRHDSLIKDIVLLGRQFNFGLIAIMQQASVGNSGLDSLVKEQFGLVVHMGNATSSALRQTFGEDIEHQKFRFKNGQGQLRLDSLSYSNMTRPFTAKKLYPHLLWKDFETNFYDQNDEKALFDHELKEQ
ncbi:cell division protein FtsK [uncultured Vagococcus sp.]|uniref:cell division protein FtsK n=1 Tax=uncultured Vagococcus sp. TaxID=189676 RepID=UPI00258D77F2|nr:cell division protein FtsK [uncultured Vagococcus sp.]